MGMISILLVVLTEVFSSTLDVRRESESISSVEQDGNFLLNRFMYDIPRATNINQPNADGVTDTALDITIDGASFIYSINNGNLELTTGGTTKQLNGIDSTISNLTFKRIGNDDAKDTIQLGFTVTSKIQRTTGPESKSYQTTVGLR
ncbi:hypothetical protein A3C25_03350 [Candidatus Roizmanbacteria bacterium RIFCSPHIGHO2_02_FULL_38_11]|uniref:Uncharacterized protein n=1 Tax=Candidatus Roizmanbacteria bacterium RIFCSPHIGHO2_02_FULL_38_11 TaxID=1802039 RepID=A0A1F7H1R0_9BACT|nr:MAG: hypothetical protein A3C25_03350 [Candidatus Roizmanbacteria bacterium RIFCSPHIGHO2_02_FULL_38_11]